MPLGTACGAHIELAPHRGLVDALKGAVFRVLAAGEVEELVQGSGTGLGVPCPFHSEVLGESWGRCGVDTRRLIQGGQSQCSVVTFVIAGVLEPEVKDLLLELRDSS